MSNFLGYISLIIGLLLMLAGGQFNNTRIPRKWRQTGNDHATCGRCGGVEFEYQVLLDYSKKHNLFLRRFPTCMMFAPQANIIISLFTALPCGGNLEEVSWFEGVEKYQGFP